MPTKKYLHNIDLAQNELISAVLQKSATDPAGAVEGQVYYNTTDKIVKYYNATTAQWSSIGTNIYNANGTLTANRVVTLDDKQLVFRSNASTLQNYTFTVGTPTGVTASSWPSSVVYEGEYLINSFSSAEPFNTRVWGRNQTASTKSLWVNQVYADITGESTGTVRIYNQTYRTARGSTLDTSTSTSAQMWGVYNNIGHWYTGASATTTQITTASTIGFYSNMVNLVGNMTWAVGYYNRLQATTVTAAQNSTITDYYGFLSDVTLGTTSGPTATVTNFYGVYINTPAVGATGTITNRWGFYAPDAVMKHYLNGTVLIGSASDTTLAKLQVTGAIQQTSVTSGILKANANGVLVSAVAGTDYLTSYTETDPVYTASSWYTTTNNSTNWNTAYGWGNHAGLYLTVNNPAYTGTLQSGTLTYTPSNALGKLQTDVVGYNQFVIQNSDNGTFSSSDFVVSNDLSTDSTYYGSFGMNSSQFSGAGSFALPNAVYVYASEADLVLGTVTNKPIRFVTNDSDTDSVRILATGQVVFPFYTANNSFSGTAAGIIGFTSAGSLITIDASTIGSGTVTSVQLSAGVGISLSGTNPITTSGIITVTNSAPDQVVTLTQGDGLTITGTYPSFSLTNSDRGSSQNIFKNIAVNLQTTITAASNNETLTVAAGTGVTLSTNNTTKTLTITNSSPDQTVSLTAGTATSISGTYPNFTIGASYTPVNKAGDTMLGFLTLSGDPASPLHAVTKQYVDAAGSTSIHVHDPVRVQTTANLTATYTQGGTTPTVTAIATNDTLTIGSHSLVANDVIVFNSTTNGLTAGVPYFVYDAPSGTSIRISETYGGAVKSNLTNGTGLNITSRANSGVGSTLTNAGTQAALVIDGVTLIVGDRVLVNVQTNAFENGIYTVTNVGSGSTNWVLTRATTSNKYGISTPDTVNEGDYHFVQEGNTNGGKSYVLTTEGVIIFGTTNLTFTQFSGSVSYTGGTNIDVNGQTISLTGQVAVANGGTGASTLTGVLIGNGTSAVTGVAGTASQLLRRNSGNSAYEFFTPVYNSRTVTVVSANTTAAAAANTDYVYLASGVTTITLPTAVGNTGKYTVKNTGTNTVIVNTTSSQTIDGSTSVTIAVRYTALDFISDGSNWNII